MEIYRFDAVGDVNDASDTTQLTFVAPFAGKVYLKGAFIQWTEATGSQTTTQGVLSIEIDGTEVATLTAPVSSAIGTTTTWTPSAAVGTVSPYVTFDAGDTIAFLTKTQAVDGTVTGDGNVYLPIAFGV